MAVIGEFRSDLSITRKTDGNFGKFPQVFCFPKSRINENGGKLRRKKVGEPGADVFRIQSYI